MKLKKYIVLLFLTFSICAFAQYDKWMGDNWTKISNKPFHQIILPGANQIGLYQVEKSTANIDRCNSQTQEVPLIKLLNSGARYLEFSLVYWKDEKWYLGKYYENFRNGKQYACGESFESAISQLNSFAKDASHKNETVIIHITNIIDSRNPSTNKQDLIKKIREDLELSLKEYMCQLNDWEVTPNQILTNLHSSQKKPTAGLILIIEDEKNNNSKDKKIKLLSLKSEDPNDLEKELKRIDSKEELYTIFPWILFWKSTDNKCTKNQAEIAETVLLKNLNIIQKNKKPNVIALNFFNSAIAREIINLN